MTWMTARMAALSVALVSGVIATAGNGVPTAPAVTGLDHIPIAVQNLEAAAERYRAFGFSLKPGRPHENGIRNEHVKFPDGTELELITAPEARDRLTTTYRKHLAGGDGPAFLAFFAQTVDDAVRQLAPPYVFFGPRNHSPTDRPEHFAHPNGADSLIGVWLAADDLSRERRLLQAIGATLERKSVHVPEAFSAEVAQLPEGTVVLLPGRRQAVPGRPIAGATVRVTDLAAARRLLERVPGVSLRSASGSGWSSVFLPPALTHGLWLELRELR
jgi:catechol 2,3-dioxygenase-like lactoylglutathione lyase family enzyme